MITGIFFFDGFLKKKEATFFGKGEVKNINRNCSANALKQGKLILKEYSQYYFLATQAVKVRKNHFGKENE